MSETFRSKLEAVSEEYYFAIGQLSSLNGEASSFGNYVKYLSRCLEAVWILFCCIQFLPKYDEDENHQKVSEFVLGTGGMADHLCDAYDVIKRRDWEQVRSILEEVEEELPEIEDPLKRLTGKLSEYTQKMIDILEKKVGACKALNGKLKVLEKNAFEEVDGKLNAAKTSLGNGKIYTTNKLLGEVNSTSSSYLEQLMNAAAPTKKKKEMFKIIMARESQDENELFKQIREKVRATENEAREYINYLIKSNILEREFRVIPVAVVTSEML